MKRLLFILSILFFVSCGSPNGSSCRSHKTSCGSHSTERRVPLNAEFLGHVGGTNDFDVYKFEVDSMVYIVGVDYGTGVTLIDKNRK